MMAFALFILVNGLLILRPAEILPGLEGMPFYEWTMVACLVLAAPVIARQLQTDALVRRPITVCVLGMLVAVALSHLSHGNTWGLRHDTLTFAKLALYYLLLVGVVNTQKRLKTFLVWLALFVMALTALTLADYHGFIQIPGMAAYRETQIDPDTGLPIVIDRLQSFGIFNDPNDLCLILLLGASLCLYHAGNRRVGGLRWLWVAPAMMMGYAIALTHSRGGFLALLACMGVGFLTKYGWRKTMLIGAAVLPLLFVLFAGRATEISATKGTGQDRIHLWAEGLALLKSQPLFGVGMNQYDERVGQVAHNSFIHCFVELGIVGGALFLMEFIFAGKVLARREPAAENADLRRLRPFLLAILAAYATGFMSLSRPYMVTTFLVLGLVTAYLRVSGLERSFAVPRFDMRFVKRAAAAAVVFLVVAYVFIRVFGRWG